MGVGSGRGGELKRDQKAAARQLSLAAYLLSGERARSEAEIRENLRPYSDIYDASAGPDGADRESASEALRKQLGRDVEALRGAGIRVGVESAPSGRLYRLSREGLSPLELDLTTEEKAVLVGALRALRRDFPYSGPLRLALANMIGSVSPDEATGAALAAVATREDEEVAARVAVFESAVLRKKRVRFTYYAISSDETTERTFDPYVLSLLDGVWYVTGFDAGRGEVRQFRLSRIQGRVTFVTKRDAGDFSLPEDFEAGLAGARAPWQMDGLAGAEPARILLSGNAGREANAQFGGVEATQRGPVFVTRYTGERQLAGWTLSLGEGARVLSPEPLRERVLRGLRKIQTTHREGP